MLSTLPGRLSATLGRAVFAAALLLAAPAALAAEQEAAGEQADGLTSLRYGVSLYYFYQQDYFDALSELMVAQQLGELATHAAHSELLRAGMSLSYGMDRVAESLFRQMLAQSGPTVDRDKAWFYLAKIAWQRGELARAEAALGSMSAGYDGSLAAEADYLRASISLRRGDLARATSLAARLPGDSPWRYYLDYNLGAALAAGGDWSAAIAAFQRLGPQPLPTAEGLALQDKAYTAAGFAAMAAGEYAQAAGEFTRVRLESPLADRALLGYGWAFAEQDNYREALSPWLVLGEQDPVSASVRESLLAIPYAYEQLGLPGTALQRYRLASQVYAAELARLQAAIEGFSQGELPALLQPANEAAGDWLTPEAILPEADQPGADHLPYIAHLVTRHPFQLALRELRDLYSMDARLTAAQQRLLVLREADREQQQSWASVIEGDRDEQLLLRQQQLEQQVVLLRQRLQTAAASGDTRLLAGTEQAARWQRLERAEQLAASLPVTAEQRRQLALYRGLLIWEDNENYPGRAWELNRQLEDAEALVEQTRAGTARLDDAMARRRQSGYAPRIAALETRVQAGADRVQQAIAAAQQRLRQVAVAELQRQTAQLSHSLGQSRLAIARLYDQGSPEVPR